jgi:MFS family permease
MNKLRDIFKINKIIKILVFSDILILSGFGLFAPIFAVFLTDKIVGASLVVVGIADFIYLITKSLVQIPVGILIDKTKGEKIDFWFTFGGSLLATLSVLLYINAIFPWHIYIAQVLYGLGIGVAYPGWMGLFTRNMEGGRESFVWSLHSTLVEFSSALAAAAGGLIAERFGFNILFISVFVICLIGTLSLFGMFTYINEQPN